MIIFDVVEVIRDSMKNQGFDKRNFIEILNSKRRGTTMSNLVARDLEHLEATKSTKTTEQYQEELKMIVENFGKDIGIEMNLIYTDEAHMPKDSKGKGGAARRESDGKLVAYVDIDKNKTTSELLRTVFEEVAHLIDLQAGRKRETTREEQQRGEHGLETLGRPIGNYFKDKYEETSTDFTNAQIDTEDYTDVDGETVGNVAAVDDIVIVAVAGTYVVYMGSKKLVEFATSVEAKEYVRKIKLAIGSILDELKKKGREVLNVGSELIEGFFAKFGNQVNPGEIIGTPDTKPGSFKRGKNEGDSGFENIEDGSWWEKDRAGNRSHGGSTWKRWPKKPKLKNKKKDRRTVGDDGKVLRE